MSGSLAAAGYIHMHLRTARRGIWKLLQGDWNENRRVLAAGPPPDKSDSLYKPYEILRTGLGDHYVIDGFKLLWKVSWTTLPEEHGHVKSTNMAASHKGYGAETL